MSPLCRRAVALACATASLLLIGAYTARPVADGESPSPTPMAAASTPKQAVDQRIENPAPTAAPARIAIPGMSLAAVVVPVGLNSTGGMDVPPDPQVLGWYDGGAGAGSTAGSMVIAGHVNTRIDGPGVLARLTSVRTGTVIQVTTKDGTIHSYRVTGSQQIHKRDLPLASVFADQGSPVLRLITCTGRFLGRGLGYEDNLVVTAVPTT